MGSELLSCFTGSLSFFLALLGIGAASEVRHLVVRDDNDLGDVGNFTPESDARSNSVGNRNVVPERGMQVGVDVYPGTLAVLVLDHEPHGYRLVGAGRPLVGGGRVGSVVDSEPLDSDGLGRGNPARLGGGLGAGRGVRSLSGAGRHGDGWVQLLHVSLGSHVNRWGKGLLDLVVDDLRADLVGHPRNGAGYVGASSGLSSPRELLDFSLGSCDLVAVLADEGLLIWVGGSR